MYALTHLRSDVPQPEHQQHRREGGHSVGGSSRNQWRAEAHRFNFESAVRYLFSRWATGGEIRCCCCASTRPHPRDKLIAHIVRPPIQSHRRCREAGSEERVREPGARRVPQSLMSQDVESAASSGCFYVPRQWWSEARIQSAVAVPNVCGGP